MLRFENVLVEMEEMGMVEVLISLGISMEDMRHQFDFLAFNHDFFEGWYGFDEDLMEYFESFGFDYYDYFE